MNKEQRKKIVSERIRQLMEDNCMKSKTVCSEVLNNYSPTNFSRFINAKAVPPDWIMQKLAEYFQVRLQWLYGIDDVMTVEQLSAFNEAVSQQNEIAKDRLKSIGMSMDDIIEALIDSSIRDLNEEGEFSDIKNQYLYVSYIENQIRSASKFYKENLNDIPVPDTHEKK